MDDVDPRKTQFSPPKYNFGRDRNDVGFFHLRVSVNHSPLHCNLAWFIIIMLHMILHLVLVMVMVKGVWDLGPTTSPTINIIVVLVVMTLCHL